MNTHGKVMSVRQPTYLYSDTAEWISIVFGVRGCIKIWLVSLILLDPCQLYLLLYTKPNLNFITFLQNGSSYTVNWCMI
jgi:hypothetical protein